MKQKLILRTCMLLVFLTVIYSCIHDDLNSASDPGNSLSYDANKEYQSKSPWKEDEKYIKNVKAVFDEYADKNYFSTNFGTIYWDYSVTMGTEETFLEAPVIKNGKVNYILVVYKEGDRVFFKRKDDEGSKKFFSALVFNNRTKLTNSRLYNSLSDQAKGGCITIETTWTWTNDDGSPGPTYTFIDMQCLPSGPSLPCQSLEIDGNCGGSTGGNGGSGGSGSGGGGYPYTPEVKQLIDNCKVVKDQTTNTDFKNRITTLEGNTGLKSETGYIQRTDGNYTYKDTAGQTENSNTLSLPDSSLPENKNIMGYLHTHPNDYTYIDSNGDERMRNGIKMFSPADVSYFMDMLKNAQEAGRPLMDVYSVMVSSSGNYQLRFTGNQYQIKSFTKNQIEAFKEGYIEYMNKYNGDLESGFLNFISDKMNIKATNLYKMDKNGTNYEIKLTPEKAKTTTGCPG